MNRGRRSSRQAAIKAEHSLEVIAKQEDDTRHELYDIAAYEERSAHISKVPTKIITVSAKSTGGRQLLQELAEEYPDAAAPVQTFITLKLTSDAAKQRFSKLCSWFVQWPSVALGEVDSELEGTTGEAIYDAVLCKESHDTHGSYHAGSMLSSPPNRTAVRRRRSSSLSALDAAFKRRRKGFIIPGSQIRIHPPVQQVIEVPAAGWRPNSFTQQQALQRQPQSPFVSPKPTQRCWPTSTSPPGESMSHSNSLIPGSPNSTELPAALKPQPTAMNPDFFSTKRCENMITPEREPMPTQSLDVDEAHVKMPSMRANNFTSTNIDFMELPPRDLPEHDSYRVGLRQNQRLMKYQPPPNGWEGTITSPYNNDYSDPRHWSAKSFYEQNCVWEALLPTRNQYFTITGEIFDRDQASLLPYGYEATFNQIHNVFSQWCFSNLESKHRLTKGGKVHGVLFKLERWYGLLGDYEFAPNWPTPRKDPNGRILQNPDCFACQECVDFNVFCHGHREDHWARCKPCQDNKRDCSKMLV